MMKWLSAEDAVGLLQKIVAPQQCLTHRYNYYFNDSLKILHSHE
jgi:hypothetical protein